MEYKEHKEKEKQKDLALAQENLQREQKSLSELEKIKHNCEKTLLEKRKEKINLRENHFHQVYLTKISRGVKKQNSLVREKEKEFNQKLENLLEATKEKKSLENLKGKKLISYLKDVLRAEQKEMDEFARDISKRLVETKP
jgi:flagellar export protein FliJ